MTGLPTSVLKVDDGTGTYPTTLTTRVVASDGVTISGYGRTDEQPSATSATLSLTLDNADGLLTTGGAALTVGQGIRFTETIGATTRNRFTGRISEMLLGWMGGQGSNAVVVVTAVDDLADLGRTPLRSMLEQEILSDTPTAYYTLGEAEGSMSAGDTSGNYAPPLVVSEEGSALPMKFGNGTGPVDGLSAAQFTYDGINDSQYLSAASTAFTSGGSFSLEMFAASTLTPSTRVDLTLRDDLGRGTGIQYDAPNSLVRFSFAGGVTTVAASSNIATHHFMLTFDGATMRGYMDGILIASTGAALTANLTTITVGGSSSGTISHVAVYDGLQVVPTHIASHAAVGLGTLSETTAARFARFAGYAGIGTVSTPSNSGQLMGTQLTSGSSAYDALNSVAAAEGGVMFVDGSGLLTMQGRSYRAAKVTADQTLASQDLGADTALVLDAQQIINQATVTRTGGASQYAENAVSVVDYGSYATSFDLAVDSDATALNTAQWIVAKHSTPAPRIGSLTLDLQASSTAETTFARDVGDRVALSSMPTQMWTAAGDVVIEGWTETLTHDSWSLTVNLLPWDLFQAFILNNATYGVLNTSTLG